MMFDPRHIRHKSSQCVTCAGQCCRHIRHTPLGGVTIVTLAGALAGPRNLRKPEVGAASLLILHTEGGLTISPREGGLA